MADRHTRQDMESGDKSNNDKGKAARSGKNKTKDNLMDYTKQLTSLGALQQVIVRNLQKEVENID